MFIRTEKKYWENGYRKYGRNFHTLTFSVGKIGFMITGPWWKDRKIFEISLFKLV